MTRSGDIWSGGALAALGVFVVTKASDWTYSGPDGPGPGFFPMWYGVALVVLSLLLVASALKKRERLRDAAPSGRGEVARALGAWAAFAACAALLPVLGFLLSFALLTVFVACFMYGRPLRVGIIAGALGAAAFYLVFPVALEVALPVGLLGF